MQRSARDELELHAYTSIGHQFWKWPVWKCNFGNAPFWNWHFRNIILEIGNTKIATSEWPFSVTVL